MLKGEFKIIIIVMNDNNITYFDERSFTNKVDLCNYHVNYLSSLIRDEGYTFWRSSKIKNYFADLLVNGDCRVLIISDF